jgi:hypothetical protein
VGMASEGAGEGERNEKVKTMDVKGIYAIHI